MRANATWSFPSLEGWTVRTHTHSSTDSQSLSQLKGGHCFTCAKVKECFCDFSFRRHVDFSCCGLGNGLGLLVMQVMEVLSPVTYCHVLFPKPRRRSTSSNEVSGCIIVSCIVPCWAHTKSQRRASWCSCWFPLLKQGGRISASKPVADRFHSKFRFLKFLLRLYLLNFASVSSTDDFDSSLTVFTGAGFVASGVALWNIAVVEPLGQGSWT